MGDLTKCWLNQDEFARLEKTVGEWDWSREIAMQLMGRCGLRADEANSITDDDLWWADEGECWRLEVRGKNTTGGEPTLLDAWMPETVADDVHKYPRELA